MSQILVVEDDRDLRGILRKGMELRGHRVNEAANGWEALLAVDEVGPTQIDLIVLDMLMPGMDGATFLRILRSAGARKAWIPVLVLSVLDRATVQSRLGRLQVEGVVQKRFDLLDGLLDQVDHLVGDGETSD